MLQHKDIVVIIPVYKAALSAAEQGAVAQGRDILAAYTRVLVCPKTMDASAYLAIDADLQIERFDDTFFASIKGYNQLMLSPSFYARFRKYQFMLIYQTDAWVFRDELLDWCQKGYDYIGAPWVTMPPLTKKPIVNLSALLVGKVGNGGFGIRNIAKHYYSALIFRPLSFIFSKNEDFFWCYIMPKINPFYRLPKAAEALHFAFELEPSRCFEQTAQQLPFGCHAWEKYEPEFWGKFIKVFP
jgi:Protein of unknown function (DUF5672)